MESSRPPARRSKTVLDWATLPHSGWPLAPPQQRSFRIPGALSVQRQHKKITFPMRQTSAGTFVGWKILSIKCKNMLSIHVPAPLPHTVHVESQRLRLVASPIKGIRAPYATGG